jgi:hypothetical protein
MFGLSSEVNAEPNPRKHDMQAVHDGQCGLCEHFGEHQGKTNVLVTILSNKKAEETLLDECGHPKHAALHLKVSPISGCDAFVPAASN